MVLFIVNASILKLTYTSDNIFLSFLKTDNAGIERNQFHESDQAKAGLL